MIIGFFNTATVAVGVSNFITQYINVPKVLMIRSSITITSVINILGNKYSTAFNKGIMSLIVGSFTLLMALAGVRGKHFSENAVVPKKW